MQKTRYQANQWLASGASVVSVVSVAGAVSESPEVPSTGGAALVVAGAAVSVVAGAGVSVVVGAGVSVAVAVISGTGGTSSVVSGLGASLADLLFFRKRLSFFGSGDVGWLLELDGSSSVSDLTSAAFFFPSEKKLARRLPSFGEEASATFSSVSFTASVSSGLVSAAAGSSF